MKWVKPDYSKRRVRRAGERLIDATSTSAELNNAMDEALGRKERMVADFSRLGDLYEARGEFDLAGEMYFSAIEINFKNI